MTAFLESWSLTSFFARRSLRLGSLSHLSVSSSLLMLVLTVASAKNLLLVSLSSIVCTPAKLSLSRSA